MATRSNSGECKVCGDVLATNDVQRLIAWLQQAMSANDKLAATFHPATQHDRGGIGTSLDHPCLTAEGSGGGERLGLRRRPGDDPGCARAGGRTVTPYYDADGITLYLGDCQEQRAWLDADVLVTDPPYGMAYYKHSRAQTKGAVEVLGDTDTSARDEALSLWGSRPALVFGSWRNTRPHCDQIIVWDKGEEAAMGHPVFFSAHEEIYVIGQGWTGPRRPNVLRINGLARGGGLRKGLDHPTPKPVALMETLLAHCPPGVIADPFAGSGATLLAARAAGRRAVGVEVEERYCEVIAKRLSQGDLFGGAA